MDLGIPAFTISNICVFDHVLFYLALDLVFFVGSIHPDDLFYTYGIIRAIRIE